MRKITGNYRTLSSLVGICIFEVVGRVNISVITCKTATLVPGFAVEDLPLGRTSALVPEFAVKDMPLGIILEILTSFVQDIKDHQCGFKRYKSTNDQGILYSADIRENMRV